MNDEKKDLLRRELATRKLKYFCQYVMPTFNLFPYTELICDSLDLLIDQVVQHIVINVPPQRGKSELLSRKGPPFALGKHPDWKIMLTCYNASLAHTLSRAARDTVKSDEFSRVFGEQAVDEEDAVKLSEDSRSVSNWGLHNRRGGMLATGVGGGLPGHAADWLIIDDPVKDDQEYISGKLAEEQEHWFWSVAYPRVSKEVGLISLCQTRWLTDDLTGRILKRQPETGVWFYVLRLPAESETPEDIQMWAEQHNVSPEFMLTKHNVAVLREMYPEERPHARKAA